MPRPQGISFANEVAEQPFGVRRSVEIPGKQTAALNELTNLRAKEVSEHLSARRLATLFKTPVYQPGKYVNRTSVLKETPITKINRSPGNVAQAKINLKRRFLNADDKGLEIILCEMMASPENTVIAHSDLNMLFSKEGRFYGRENLPKEVLNRLIRQRLSEKEEKDIEYLLKKEGPTQPLQCGQEPAVPTKFLTGDAALNAAFLANVANEEARNAAAAAAVAAVAAVAAKGGASRKKKMHKRKRTTRKH